MLKYCAYCGNRLKKANIATIVRNLNSTPIYAINANDNRKLLILPNESTWALYDGEGDYSGGNVYVGNLNIDLNDVLNTNRYRRHFSNNIDRTYYQILNNADLKLNENSIEVSDNNTIVNRYVAYLTQNNTSMLSFKSISYANEADLLSIIQNGSEKGENGTDQKERKRSVPKKRVSAEEGWKHLLEGVALKTLNSKGILFLLGDSPGMTADIKNVIKNEYDGLDKLREFKKESPEQADHSEGERDYYDIVMYHPSIKSKLREDVKIHNKTIISFEDKYGIADIKIDDKTYKLGLLHRVG